MKKRIIHICVLVTILLLLIYFIALPIIKWNINYDLSSVTSGEKAVEYYLNSIDEKNPKKSLTIYPSLNEYDSKPGIFGYSLIEYCKIINIEEISDDYNDLTDDGEKLYMAEFSWRFAFGESPNAFISLSDGDCILFFKATKNIETGNWYILDSYTGI